VLPAICEVPQGSNRHWSCKLYINAIVTVCRFCLVQLDKYIYAVGGCNMEGNLSSVARYLEDSDDWDFVCPMPVAL